jgi:hypothetical protein
MWAPLAILALFAAGIGGLLFLTGSFDRFLLHAPSLAIGWVSGTAQPGAFHLDVAFISSLVAGAGVICAVYLYLGERNQVTWLQSMLNFQWLTKVTDGTFVASFQRRPLISNINRAARRVGLGWLALLVGDVLLLIALVLSLPLLIGVYISPYRLSLNKFYFDEIYQVLFVWPLSAIAALSYWIDRWIVDGLVNVCGWIPRFVGGLFRSLQTGLMQFYALAMILGLAILLAARLLFAG